MYYSGIETSVWEGANMESTRMKGFGKGKRRIVLKPQYKRAKKSWRSRRR